MNARSIGDHTRNDMLASGVGHEEATRSIASPNGLAEEIETLEEEIAILEERVSQAPGTQRVALAKEIAEYRAELDSKQQTLCQRRESGAIPGSNREVRAV
jgi:hypothetical protein